MLSSSGINYRQYGIFSRSFSHQIGPTIVRCRARAHHQKETVASQRAWAPRMPSGRCPSLFEPLPSSQQAKPSRIRQCSRRVSCCRRSSDEARNMVRATCRQEAPAYRRAAESRLFVAVATQQMTFSNAPRSPEGQGFTSSRPARAGTGLLAEIKLQTVAFSASRCQERRSKQ